MSFVHVGHVINTCLLSRLIDCVYVCPVMNPTQVAAQSGNAAIESRGHQSGSIDATLDTYSSVQVPLTTITGLTELTRGWCD